MSFKVTIFDDDMFDDDYREKLIKYYKRFNKIWENIPVLDCDQITASKNTEAKCYFGRGSYPVSISSWQVKTNALLYDTFLFSADVFYSMVMGPIPPNLNDDEDIWHFSWPIDFKVSDFLIDLYKNGHVKLVNSTDVWYSKTYGNIYETLKEGKKLYTEKTEIEDISKNAALFPGDESNYPGLLNLMNEDIMTSYLTESSIITQEYSSYIKRKLDNLNQIKSKDNIINHLLKYEVPNFDSLDYHKIDEIRKLKSLSNLRTELEESSQNIAESTSDVEEIVQSLRNELWELALDNIEDSKSKVMVESLISNVPVLSSFISIKTLLKVDKLQNHWGYTILEMKKNK